MKNNSTITYPLLTYNEPTPEGDIFLPGCISKESLEKAKQRGEITHFDMNDTGIILTKTIDQTYNCFNCGVELTDDEMQDEGCENCGIDW